jgi:hypothetical protein
MHIVLNATNAGNCTCHGFDPKLTTFGRSHRLNCPLEPKRLRIPYALTSIVTAMFGLCIALIANAIRTVLGARTRLPRWLTPACARHFARQCQERCGSSGYGKLANQCFETSLLRCKCHGHSMRYGNRSFEVTEIHNKYQHSPRTLHHPPGRCK